MEALRNISPGDLRGILDHRIRQKVLDLMSSDAYNPGTVVSYQHEMAIALAMGVPRLNPPKFLAVVGVLLVALSHHSAAALIGYGRPDAFLSAAFPQLEEVVSTMWRLYLFDRGTLNCLIGTRIDDNVFHPLFVIPDNMVALCEGLETRSPADYLPSMNEQQTAEMELLMEVALILISA